MNMSGIGINIMKKILIVDDDRRVVSMLVEYMKLYGYTTLCADNGKDALAFYDETVDLIILDINMKEMNGVEVCRRIRAVSNVPIIMLSANAASFDKVQALGAGADDYVVKPFDPIELMARIKAHIGRVERFKVSLTKGPIVFDSFKIYREAYKVTKEDVEIKLSHTEFRLLVYLVDHAFTAVSRSQILTDIWESDLYDENIVNTYVKRLRLKLGCCGDGYIKSIRGVGYMFEGQLE